MSFSVPGSPAPRPGDLLVVESSSIVPEQGMVRALEMVRDGVITGEGPTTAGRAHFSRALDAIDADWCARILSDPSAEFRPVTRDEARVLFEIDAAASERSDSGRFDQLSSARAILHHAVASSGLPVPPLRSVALSQNVAVETSAPASSAAIDTAALAWINTQMRGRRPNKTVTALIGAFIGAASLPLAQSLPGVIDLGM